MNNIEQFTLLKDGSNIRGCYHHPDKPNGKVVMFLVGYSSSISSGTRTMRMQSERLAENGFEVVRFDYLGYGESDKYFKDANISSMVDDSLFMIDHIVEKYPGYEIILSGNSMGGMVTMVVANKNPHPEVFKKIVLNCPALDFYNVYMNRGFKQGLTVPMADIGGEEYEQFWEGDLKTYENLLEEYNFKGQAMIAHGDKDECIPYEPIKDFAEKNNLPLYTIKGGKHDFTQEGWSGPEAIRENFKQRYLLWDAIDAFIK